MHTSKSQTKKGKNKENKCTHFQTLSEEKQSVKHGMQKNEISSSSSGKLVSEDPKKNSQAKKQNKTSQKVINENQLTMPNSSISVSTRLYDLRKRTPTKKIEKELIIKKSTTTIAKRDASLSVTALFNICKRKNIFNLMVGEIVLAKMRTYSPWPAKIMEINVKKAKVYFFGTNNHGDVNLFDCVPASECGAVISKLLDSKQADYRKAVYEMKTIMELTGMPTFE